MADFRPVEATKARILSVRPAPTGTQIERANAEWIEVIVQLDSDLANWRLQHLRALWREELAKPVEWEWLYTWGSPAFVRAGEIYRVHSGSRVRGDYARLIDAFGTVIDEIVVWPEEEKPKPQEAPARR